MSDDLKHSTVLRGLLDERMQTFRVELAEEQEAAAKAADAEAERLRVNAKRLRAAAQVTLMEAEIFLAEKAEFCAEAEAEIAAREAAEDKAIAALSPGNDLGLLDDGQRSDDLSNSLEGGEEGPDDMHESCAYCGSQLSLDDPDTCMTDDGWQCPKCTASAREEYAHVKQEFMQRDGVLIWEGGDVPPVKGATLIEALFRNGRVAMDPASCFMANVDSEPHCWRHDDVGNDIIAYRIVETPADESQATDQDRVEQADLLLENQPGVSSQASSGEAAEIVDGADAWAFTEFMNLTGATQHHGGACPVAVGAHVEIFTRGCREWPVRNIEEVATHWTWKDATPHPTDIIAYREIEAPADAERTEVASEPRDTNEQTGIFQSQTEAALNDKDEPDPAPYAPINAEEPAGDAAVFARGMMEEAKEPQPPSWLSMFMGKAKVDA